MVFFNENCVDEKMSKSDVQIRQSAESMVLVAGSLSGFWIWNKKTLNNWRQIFYCESRRQTYNLSLGGPDIVSTLNTQSTNLQPGNTVRKHFPV